MLSFGLYGRSEAARERRHHRVRALLALAIVVLLAAEAASAAPLPRNSVGSPQVKPNSLKGIDINEGTLGPVPLSLNSSQLQGKPASDFQLRVHGVCPAGQAIFAIGLDGSVQCLSVGGGGGPTYTAGEGLQLNGTMFAVDFGLGMNEVARGDHNHDGRYFTETELETGGSAGVHWDNLTTVPAGFADGIDDTGGTPSGPAGGDLTGEYPNPSIGPGAVDAANLAFDPATQAELDSLGNTVWRLGGNANATPGSFLGTTNAQSLQLRTSNATRIVINAGGGIDFQNNAMTNVGGLTTNGALVTNGPLTATNQVTLGDSLADNVVVNGTLSSSTLSNAGTINSGGNPVDWTKLKNVPGEIADGDDDPGWALTGNGGTDSGTNFLGTTDLAPLPLRTNGANRLVITGFGEIDLYTTLDAQNNVITNIGDVSTDFAPGGGLTLAGPFNALSSVTLGDSFLDQIRSAGPFTVRPPSFLASNTDMFSVENSSLVDLFNVDSDGDARLLGGVSTGFGSAATPSFAFTGDPNTGLYRSGPDQLGISAGGVQRVAVTPEDLRVSGYLQIRVDSMAPPAADCDATAEAGRMLATNDGLWVCVSSPLGWKTITFDP